MRGRRRAPIWLVPVCLISVGACSSGRGSPATPEDAATLRAARAALLDDGAAEEAGTPCATADARVSCLIRHGSQLVRGTWVPDALASVAFERAVANSGLSPRQPLEDVQGTHRSRLAAELDRVLTEVESAVAGREDPEAPVAMARYVLVLLRGGVAPRPVDEARVRSGHFEALGRLEREGRLVFAGPTATPALEGVILLRARDLDEARTLVGRDPAVQAGLLVAEVHQVWLPSGIGWPNPKYGGPS